MHLTARWTAAVAACTAVLLAQCAGAEAFALAPCLVPASLGPLVAGAGRTLRPAGRARALRTGAPAPIPLCMGAKKKPAARKSSAVGFGAAAAPEPKRPPVVAASPCTESFSISEFQLPEGEGISTLFVGAFMVEDESVCDDLVALWEANPSSHKPGVVGRDGKPVVDPTRKESMEMSFMPNDPRPEWQRYLAALQQVTRRYVEKYPYAANHVGQWGLSSATNFQHYPPGGGYKVFHTERRDRAEPGASRHLVFMTYLNDVDDEGGTEFFHQKLVVQPRKGLTLVWPADWTFMHRGIASPTQEKRIMTGWFNFA